MYNYFAYGYPTWLVEGYAEYFMATRIDGEEIDIGRPGRRAQQLPFDVWMPLKTTLGKSTKDMSPDRLSMDYARAWALTHYMMSDPDRAKPLHAYMLAVGAGLPERRRHQHPDRGPWLGAARR